MNMQQLHNINMLDERKNPTDGFAILRALTEARFSLPVQNRLKHWLGRYNQLILADHRYWYQQTTYVWWHGIDKLPHRNATVGSR